MRAMTGRPSDARCQRFGFTCRQLDPARLSASGCDRLITSLAALAALTGLHYRRPAAPQPDAQLSAASSAPACAPGEASAASYAPMAAPVAAVPAKPNGLVSVSSSQKALQQAAPDEAAPLANEPASAAELTADKPSALTPATLPAEEAPLSGAQHQALEAGQAPAAPGGEAGQPGMCAAADDACETLAPTAVPSKPAAQPGVLQAGAPPGILPSAAAQPAATAAGAPAVCENPTHAQPAAADALADALSQASTPPAPAERLTAEESAGAPEAAAQQSDGPARAPASPVACQAAHAGPGSAPGAEVSDAAAAALTAEGQRPPLEFEIPVSTAVELINAFGGSWDEGALAEMLRSPQQAPALVAPGGGSGAPAAPPSPSTESQVGPCLCSWSKFNVYSHASCRQHRTVNTTVSPCLHSLAAHSFAVSMLYKPKQALHGTSVLVRASAVWTRASWSKAVCIVSVQCTSRWLTGRLVAR